MKEEYRSGNHNFKIFLKNFLTFFGILSVFFLFFNGYTTPLYKNNLSYLTGLETTEFWLNVVFYMLSVLSIQILLLNRIKAIRITSEILLFSFIYMDLAYILISKNSFGLYESINMVNNYHFAGLAFQSFTLKFIFAFIITSILFYIGYILTKNYHKNIPVKCTFLPFLLIVSLVIVNNHEKKSLDLLPPIFRIPFALIYAFEEKNTIATQRTPVNIKVSNNGIKHVFIIVDESISSRALSVNGNSTNTTPYLKANNEKIINFGNAVSYSNHSAGSNISLISGVNLEELPDFDKKMLKNPTIFQYGKSAGYTTYYIDAQTSNGSIQNYLSQEDMNFVDHYFQPSNLSDTIRLFQRDFIIADTLVALSKSKEKIMVYVNKAGAHWPYDQSYPSNKQQYKNRENENLYHYYKAISWTVDHFWERIINSTSPQDSTIMIYTSDHGENYTGNKSDLKHGSLIDVLPAEAEVPLWILDKSKLLPIQQKQVDNFIYSHNVIFPTALHIMGYDIKAIKERYGYSLFDNRGQRKTWFLTGDIFGRGRYGKIWVN